MVRLERRFEVRVQDIAARYSRRRCSPRLLWRIPVPRLGRFPFRPPNDFLPLQPSSLAHPNDDARHHGQEDHSEPDISGAGHVVVFLRGEVEETPDGPEGGVDAEGSCL